MPRRPNAAPPGAPAPGAPVRQEPAPGFIRLQRQTLAGMTLDALRERILHGVYPEGEPLRQDALAKELGVSRIPVREALRQLEAEGLVTFSPHRGAVVSTLSLDDIDEAFDLRATIEVTLLRRALANVTAEDLARAKEILDSYDAALRSGAVASWGTMNWQFHATLYAPSRRPFTLGVAQKLHRHCDRYLRMQIALTHGELRATEEHRAILSAVRQRDAARAGKLLRDHILGAGRALHDFLERERRVASPLVSRPLKTPRTSS